MEIQGGLNLNQLKKLTELLFVLKSSTSLNPNSFTGL